VDLAALGSIQVGWFRILLASKSKRFRGRDERDYIQELRAENIAFVTQDGEFVEAVISDGVRHAGIVWLPGRADRGELAASAAVGLGRLRGLLDYGGRAANDYIVKVDHQGLAVIWRGRTVESSSIEQITFEVEEYMQKTWQWPRSLRER
jgi:hypothetical protein